MNELASTKETAYNSKNEKIELKADGGYYYLYVNDSCVAHGANLNDLLSKFNQYKRA